MENWKYIVVVSLTLIGGTLSFGYWSMNQFNQAFDSVATAYLASTQVAYQAYKAQNRATMELASTTPDALVLEGAVEDATSTDLETVATSSVAKLSLSSTGLGKVTASTTPKLSLNFPKSKAKVYIGCTYNISWESSTRVSSLETTLIGTATGESSGPIASGLAKQYKIKPDAQSFDWKVGAVWPGEYVISISKVNGIQTKTQSKYFVIYKMPEGLTAAEQKNLCK